MRGERVGRAFAGVVLALAVLWSAALAGTQLFARATVFDRLEASLLDVRILSLGARRPPDSVVIIAIDEATVHLARAYPIPRRLLADLVVWLQAQGAKAVAVDMLFLDASSPEGDDALARAVAGGRAVLAAMVDYRSDPTGPLNASCELPTDPLRRAAGLGTVNIALDPSGTVRHMPMMLRCDGALYAELPLRTASLAADAEPVFTSDAVEVGGVGTALEFGQDLALHFYGPEGSLARISAADILGGRAAPDAVRGKTAIIGVTAPGAGDRYATPFDSVLPGVEIMATAIANLQTGDALVRTQMVRRLDAVFIMGLAVAGAGCILLKNVAFGLSALAGLVCAWLAVVLIGFAHNYWFAMAQPIAALLPVASVAGIGRLALGRRTERQLQRQQTTLAAFQPPAVLARLIRDPDFLMSPVERRIAVVFIDLSGFTSLGERLGAQAARELLRAWHALVEEAASACGGFVTTYMGDGAMLVWGMIDERGDDAKRAVEGAIRLQDDTLRWLASVASRTGRLGAKIGGHVGPAVLSRLGHATHQHITAIGDTVNLAARLMEAAAERNSVMALSEDLVAEAYREGLTAPVANFSAPVLVEIRGRAQELSVRFGPEGMLDEPRSSGSSHAHG